MNPLSYRDPFTQIVFGGCCALFLMAVFPEPERLLELGRQITRGRIFTLPFPDRDALLTLGMGGSEPVFQLGRWWTVLSAAWLHSGPLHFAAAMWWLLRMGPVASGVFGAGRLMIIYTLASIASFGFSSVLALLPLPSPMSAAQFTVGASGPLCGIFGALVYHGQATGQDHIGRHKISRQFQMFLLLWVVAGVVAAAAEPGVVRVDNWSHLGGFAGGYLGGLWLGSRRPEQRRHKMAALVCLALTALSIAASADQPAHL